MQRKILTLFFILIVWNNQAFSQIIISGSSTWSAYEFNQNAPSFGTWDGVNTLTITSSVLIDRGTNSGRASLTIDGIVIELHGKIEVDAGEELKIINGAVLRKAWTYWLGIRANGDPLEEQFATNIPEKYEGFTGSTTYNTAQTIVFVENSTIEDAEIGIQSLNGAIVRIQGSTIDNCRTGVDIQNYIHPNIGITDLSERNASCIDNTSFFIANPQTYTMANYDLANYVMLNLNEVYGIHIQGCGFISSYAAPQECGERGTCIKAENSTFSIHESGTATLGLDSCVTYASGSPNSFVGFSTGINCFESGIPGQRTSNSIQACTFTACEGILHANGNMRIVMTDCSADMLDIDLFTVNYSSCSPGYNFVHLESVEEFVIQRNTFTCTPPDQFPQPITMVRVDNCGNRDNKIYQNHFANSGPDATNNTSVITGIKLLNNNSHVKVWCNEFVECRYGITVESGSTINATWVNNAPGVTSGSVGNEFSGTVDRIKDLNNLSSTDIDYHETNTRWATIKPTTRWIHFTETGEASCADFPCTEWPIGVGMQDLERGPVNVFPNPVNTNDAITIQMEKPLTGTIVVYDVLGRIERTYEVYEELDIEIRDHHLRSGVHFFVVQYSSGEKAGFKLIVNE